MKSKPRVYFINLPEVNFLVHTYEDIKVGRKVKTFKHRFLLKYLMDNGYDVVNLSINEGNSRNPLKKILKNSIWWKKYVTNFVMKENGLLSIPVVKDLKKIRKDDIVVAFFYRKEQIELLSKINCYKLVFGNHFIIINDSVDLKAYGVNGFVNEVDLSNNNFVKKYLGIDGVDPIIVPYVYGNRFESRTPFEKRKNKAMAVGTASDVNVAPDSYKIYKEHFGTSQVQPMRFDILNHKDELSDIIDSYISYVGECGGKQSNYTKFDMVETFNKYKIAICPEELVGMPGIGFVEAMSSGCAYVGIDHEMYNCLGLVPNKHYIAYDGTLEGLKAKVNEILSKPEELARIAKNGTEYVRSHFNEIRVAEDFERQLLNSYNNYIKTI